MEHRPLSKRLTEKVKSQAFERTRSSVEFDEGELVVIDESRYSQALAFLKSTFVPEEPVMKCLGLEWCQELEHMCLDTLRFNLSLMVVDPTTNDVIAMRMVRVLTSTSKMELTGISNELFKKLITFVQCVEERVNYFQKYGITEAIQFYALCVAGKYRGRGIGTRLMGASVQLVENLGISPIYIKGETSSNYGKKIYQKLNMEVTGEVVIADCTVNGKTVLTGDTGEHKSVTMFAKRL